MQAKSILNRATISYGARAYHIVPTAHLPLPAEFDFADPVACARKAAAVMCNASGGHTIRDIKLRLHRKNGTANISANGVHVFYAPEVPPDGRVSLAGLSPDQLAQAVLAMEAEIEVIDLGTVVADQYGDGWKRARWSEVGANA